MIKGCLHFNFEILCLVIKLRKLLLVSFQLLINDEKQNSRIPVFKFNSETYVTMPLQFDKHYLFMYGSFKMEDWGF